MGGRDLVRALKLAAGGEGPALVLPVGRPPIAHLRVVGTGEGRVDPADIRRLTEWRNAHVDAFLTEFRATEERTARWLAQTVARDDGRILFMADAADGRTFGYLGLAFIDWERRRGEADAVVRGAPAPKGVMREALRVLLDWARAGLGLVDLAVRVRSDNPALAFYERVGFREERRRALVRREHDGEVHWVEADGGPEPAGPALVHMRYAPAGDRQP